MMQDSEPAGLAYLLAGHLIQGTDAPPLRDAVLRLERGSITAVGTRADFPADFDDVPVLNNSDRFVMPGLIDCHAHPTLFPDRQPFEVHLQAPTGPPRWDQRVADKLAASPAFLEPAPRCGGPPVGQTGGLRQLVHAGPVAA